MKTIVLSFAACASLLPASFAHASAACAAGTLGYTSAPAAYVAAACANSPAARPVPLPPKRPAALSRGNR